MQRMLVGLVLFLTAIVGVLLIMVLSLQDQVDVSTRNRQGSGPARTSGDGDVHPVQIQTLEARIDALLRQIEGLRKNQQENSSRLTKFFSMGGKAPLDRVKVPDSRDLASAKRNADNISVTEQDEAFYIAVKESVDRKRRIRATLDNTMRRLDRLARINSIQPVEGETRKKVEKALMKYTTAADDLLTRYFRKPTEQLKSMPVDERREAVREERDTIIAQARTDLEAVLGAADAETVASKLLTNPRIQRTGERGRRARRARADGG